MSTFLEAIAEAEAHEANKVRQETFGHLAPEANREYHGYTVFTWGEYGQYTIIKSHFADLPDSPWFYQDLMDFVEQTAIEQGVVYRFDGTYKNSRRMMHGWVPQFKGDVKRIEV